MINLRTDTEKRRYQVSMLRQTAVFERYVYNRARPVIKAEYCRVAQYLRTYGFYRFPKELVDKKKFADMLYHALLRVYPFFYELVKVSIRKAGKMTMAERYAESMRNYVRTYTAARVVDITSTTEKKIKKVIENGLADERSNTEIAKDLEDLADVDSRTQAERIARTEVHSAQNDAMQDAAQEEDAVEEKEWLAAMDERTRNSHVEMDGTRIAIDEDFEVPVMNSKGDVLDTDLMEYPGDPKGSGANVINCRCVCLYHTKGD